MKYKEFEDFLKEKHYEENPQLLDNDLSDAYDDWEPDVSDVIDWADEYAEIKYKEGVAFGREDTLNNLPEPDYEPADFSGACGTNDR